MHQSSLKKLTPDPIQQGCVLSPDLSGPCMNLWRWSLNCSGDLNMSKMPRTAEYLLRKVVSTKGSQLRSHMGYRQQNCGVGLVSHWRPDDITLSLRSWVWNWRVWCLATSFLDEYAPIHLKKGILVCAFVYWNYVTSYFYRSSQLWDCI